MSKDEKEMALKLSSKLLLEAELFKDTKPEYSIALVFASQFVLRESA